MRKNKSIILVLMILLMFTLSLVGCEFESNQNEKIEIPYVKANTYVYDQGNFLDDSVEANVNNLLDQLEEKTTIEFAVITIPSLNGLTIERYAVDLGNALGIGKADLDNGILLLISKEDTKVRLEIGNGLQGILTDSISGRILDQFFVPNRDEDNYDQAVIETVQSILNYLSSSDEYSFSIDGIDSEIVLEEPESLSVMKIIIIIIGIITIIILIELITGHIFGDGFGDGIIFLFLDGIEIEDDRSGSGGGFGGSSFGGSSFGGGGFSGGGASR